MHKFIIDVFNYQLNISNLQILIKCFFEFFLVYNIEETMCTSSLR